MNIWVLKLISEDYFEIQIVSFWKNVERAHGKLLNGIIALRQVAHYGISNLNFPRWYYSKVAINARSNFSLNNYPPFIKSFISDRSGTAFNFS